MYHTMISTLIPNISVKVTYRTKNNLGKLLKPHNIPEPNKYEKNGVYQLECLTCNKVYTGQTGRPFRVRYREHYDDFKYSNNKSTFAQHVVNERHSFGPMNCIHKGQNFGLISTYYFNFVCICKPYIM